MVFVNLTVEALMSDSLKEIFKMFCDVENGCSD